MAWAPEILLIIGIIMMFILGIIVFVTVGVVLIKGYIDVLKKLFGK